MELIIQPPQNSELVIRPPTQSKEDLAALVEKVARSEGIPEYAIPTFKSMANAESEWNPGVTSRKGARGLLQVMPGTAREVGIDPNRLYEADQSATAGARYFKKMLDTFGGDLDRAVAAYNAGPNNPAIKKGRIPQNGETPNYLRKVKRGLGVSEAYAADSNGLVIKPPSSSDELVIVPPAQASAQGESGGLVIQPPEPTFAQKAAEFLTGGHISYRKPADEVVITPEGKEIHNVPETAAHGFFEDPVTALAFAATKPLQMAGAPILSKAGAAAREAIGWMTGGASEIPSMARAGAEGVAKTLSSKPLAKAAEVRQAASDVFRSVSPASEVSVTDLTKTAEPVAQAVTKAEPTVEKIVSETPEAKVSQTQPEGITVPEAAPNTGTDKTRGLAQNVENKAIREALIENKGGLGDLPQYDIRHIEQATQKAKDLIDSDYDKALRIIAGKEPAPQGLYPEDVFTAVRVRAELNGDVETLKSLVNSPVVTEATELGRRIKALDSTSSATISPFKSMQEVADTRAAQAAKMGQKKVAPGEVEQLKVKADAAQSAVDDHAVAKTIDQLLNPKPEIAKYGTKNKLVSQVEYLKARRELSSMFGTQLSSGLDPAAIAHLAKIAAYHFEAGSRAFVDWSKVMIADLGPKVKPYLKDLWEETNAKVPGELLAKHTENINKAIESGKDLSEIGTRVNELAKHFIQSGVKDRETLVTSVHNVLKDIIPDITRRETADAISGYGKYKLLDKDEILVQLRDLKGQMRQVSKIEDLKSGKPPKKTGTEYPVPSDEERALIKQVEEAKKKYGVQVVDKETQLKSSLDAIKTRLMNEISDLEKQIATKQKIVKDKLSVVYDAEANKLKAKRDELKKQFDEIFAEPKQSTSERYNEARKKQLQKQIDAIEKQITTKERLKKDPVVTVNDKETADLIARKNALKAQADAMFGKTKLSDAQRLKIAENNVKKSIAEYEKKIAAGDITPMQKRSTLHSEELDRLRGERDALKDHLQTLRDAANPKKTPEQIALQSLKTKMQNEEKKLIEKLKNLDFSEKAKRQVTLDTEGIKLKAARDIAKENYQAASQASGTITDAEASEIVRLSKVVQDARTAMEQGGNRFDYGAARVAYENYINNLKGVNASIPTLVKNRMAELKVGLKSNKPLAIKDLIYDTVRTVSDNSIAMVATLDNSFIGRQGLKTLMTHPTIWWKGAKNSFIDFAKTVGGKNAHDALLADIYSRPNFLNGEYERAKILTKTEEQYPATLLERVPQAGKIFKASEYAFTGAAMRMRTGLYDLLSGMAKKNGVDMTVKENAEGLGKLINSLTARGQWGKRGEGAAVRLVLWAPKMIKANLDVLTMHGLGTGLSNNFLRKQAALNLVKIVGETAAVMAIANAISPGSAETDPRSSDFGKIIVGDTRFDITGGAASLVTLGARLYTNETISAKTGVLTEYGSSQNSRTKLDALFDFLLNKTSPPASVVRDWLRNRQFGEKDFDLGRAVYRATTPIILQQSINLQDDASADKVAGVIADTLGVSANSYDR